MATLWFYEKQITLMNQGGHMERGSWVEDAPTESIAIPCDVQPANREQLFKEYGYYIDCTKRAFCDLVEGLDAGSLVSYDGQPFDVVKVIEWNDYLDVFIKEKH